jgi:hypothetical protein
MQFFYSLILAASGLVAMTWSKTLGNLVYQHAQRRWVEGIFTGSWELPNGPIGRLFKTIGKWYVRLLIPANIVGFIFVGIVLLVMAYVISFGPIQIETSRLPSALPPVASTSVNVDRCSSIMQLQQSQALIGHLDRSETTFASTTQDVMGQTTEGGEQTTYTQAGVRQIVEQRFYGETGRSIARIYYTSGVPFALVVQNMKYSVPLSVDNNGDVQSTEERAYFLDDIGVVCSWKLNGKPQPVDQNAIDSVKTFIEGVL